MVTSTKDTFISPLNVTFFQNAFQQNAAAIFYLFDLFITKNETNQWETKEKNRKTINEYQRAQHWSEQQGDNQGKSDPERIAIFSVSSLAAFSSVLYSGPKMLLGSVTYV